MSHPPTTKEQRAAGQTMRQMFDGSLTHVRVDALDAHRIELVGTAWDLHGPDGVCVCCHGGNPKRGRRKRGTRLRPAS